MSSIASLEGRRLAPVRDEERICAGGELLVPGRASGRGAGAATSSWISRFDLRPGAGRLIEVVGVVRSPTGGLARVERSAGMRSGP